MRNKSLGSNLNLVSLVQECQREDRRAQNLLYDHYKRKLFGICLRYAGSTPEAEHIFQDAFVRIFDHIQELKNPESISSWIKSIVIRTAINHYHREIKPGKELSSLDQVEQEPEDDTFPDIVGQLEMEALVQAINQLPAGYRLVVNLYLIDGYTHMEIAEMLNISEGTSRSQFSRGKSALIKKLVQKGFNHYEHIRQNP
ncbi:MAG: hypothetical protein ABS46_18790 [Cytophagaceae bacterium SCN 52-12]|nr:MAG: hypothetical protein ABS46_18790 [Cytophagaceae bacterium SCN 52-12]